MKLPKLPKFIARFIEPITVSYAAYKAKKAAEAAVAADNKLMADLMADVSKSDEYFIRPCLENQLMYINQEIASRGVTGLVGSKPTTMALGKRVAQHLLRFRGVIGIQPIPAPASLVYSMHFREDDSSDGQKRLRLEVVSKAVTARTRKLQANYTLELVQDLAAMYDIDFETEIVSVLASECVEEYARQIVYDLRSAGEEFAATGETGPFMSSAVANVIITINRAATDIARTTCRGAGNVLIMSPIALSMLSASKHFPFVKEEDEGGDTVLTMRKAGYIGLSENSGMTGKQYTVYVSLDPSLSQDGKETIIVGYKGANGETDTAYILSPYIPVMTSGVVIDPDTFAPRVTMMTRYAQYVADGKDNEMYDVKNYYRTVTFDLNRIMLSATVE